MGNISEADYYNAVCESFSKVITKPEGGREPTSRENGLTNKGERTISDT